MTSVEGKGKADQVSGAVKEKLHDAADAIKEPSRPRQVIRGRCRGRQRNLYEGLIRRRFSLGNQGAGTGVPAPLVCADSPPRSAPPLPR